MYAAICLSDSFDMESKAMKSDKHNIMENAGWPPLYCFTNFVSVAAPSTSKRFVDMRQHPKWQVPVVI